MADFLLLGRHPKVQTFVRWFNFPPPPTSSEFTSEFTAEFD